MRRLLFSVSLILILPFLLWADQNFRIRVRYDALRLPACSSPLTIVHISDLHGMNWGNQNQLLIDLIVRQSPDLICVTGDMHSRDHLSERTVAEALMASLPSVAPTFFVPGEHDHSTDFLQRLNESGVIIPGQNGMPLSINGCDLHIYGCSRAYFPTDLDLSSAYNTDTDALKILLCHIPVPQPFANADIDLMLSGDTHGGVIRLPLLGTLFDGSRWLPEFTSTDSPLIHGIYQTGDTVLNITSGLGGPPIRLGAPPEICVIRLFPGKL